jgi:hypothetical protein
MLAIPAALAVVGAAESVSAASAQNRAAHRSAVTANAAAVAKTQQIEDAAALERTKTQNQFEQIRGRLRVAGAAAGVGLGGSFDALDEQAAVDENLNKQVINTNTTNQVASVRSGLDADLTSLASHTMSTILAGFTGGVTGAETGLRVSTAVDSYNKAHP